MNKEDVRRTLDSSSTSPTVDKSKRCKKALTARELVQTLTTFIRLEKEEKDGASKEFVVVKCPNGQYCKNGNGEIHYPNKSGYKNPLSHLRSCLAKVCLCFESFLASHEIVTNI